MSTVDPLSDLYAVLEGSALVPFLESKLQANSFLEICSHTSVYKCVVNIIREIGKIFTKYFSTIYILANVSSTSHYPTQFLNRVSSPSLVHFPTNSSLCTLFSCLSNVRQSFSWTRLARPPPMEVCRRVRKAERA